MCVCVCVCVCVSLSMSFKHLGDYVLSRMIGNFKGKMERITESNYV